MQLSTVIANIDFSISISIQLNLALVQEKEGIRCESRSSAGKRGGLGVNLALVQEKEGG